MEKVLRKLKLKHDLNKFSNKSLKNYLSDKDNYESFIDDLFLVLNEDVGYEFVQFNKLKTIKKAIKSNKEERKLTDKEKNIIGIIKLSGLSNKQKIDFKTQYICNNLYSLGVPISLRSEDFYEEVMEDSYKNIALFTDLLGNSNKYYTETTLSVLAYDITSLVTVNLIINEEETIDKDLFDLLVELSTTNTEKKYFSKSSDYYRYKRYQRKTLKNLKSKAYKVNDKENDKVLVKQNL